MAWKQCRNFTDFHENNMVWFKIDQTGSAGTKAEITTSAGMEGPDLSTYFCFLGWD